jgi:hypothetical protein
MNQFIDWISSSIKYMGKKIKLYLSGLYNKIHFLINKNYTLNKMYKPIIEEKVSINKKLQEALKVLVHKNKDAENNILKLEKENASLQAKISIIQNLLTKRRD